MESIEADTSERKLITFLLLMYQPKPLETHDSLCDSSADSVDRGSLPSFLVYNELNHTDSCFCLLDAVNNFAFQQWKQSKIAYRGATKGYLLAMKIVLT
ncbi:hypothetical protein Plhal304r1_c019g0068671 [Plasmopara halstedii]